MRHPSPPRSLPGRALRLGLLLLAGAWTVPLVTAADTTPSPGADGAVRADTAGRRRVVSVKDSPGYRPLVDPDSMAEVLGRRMDAPRVSRPFTGGARSLDDLGRTLCRLLRHERRDSLEALCVGQDEFRDILWREFPQSRPATGIQWQDAWFFQWTRNRKGCGAALSDMGGKDYGFLGVKVDSTKRYRNFRMHSRITFSVRGAEGDTLKWNWVKAVVERKGRFKLLSLRD